MSLADLINDPSPIGVSFEFSPPKTAEAEANLWTAIRRLEPLAPAFVSVTYGAGGSTRERTHATVKRIVEETSLKPAAHLTCVAASRGEIDDIVRAYWDAGIRHIVALRGDMPGMSGPYCAHPDGYHSTPELIAGITKIAPFEVSVSFYPERHPDSPSHGHDIELLKATDPHTFWQSAHYEGWPAVLVRYAAQDDERVRKVVERSCEWIASRPQTRSRKAR